MYLCSTKIALKSCETLQGVTLTISLIGTIFIPSSGLTRARWNFWTALPWTLSCRMSSKDGLEQAVMPGIKPDQRYVLETELGQLITNRGSTTKADRIAFSVSLNMILLICFPVKSSKEYYLLFLVSILRSRNRIIYPFLKRMNM